MCVEDEKLICNNGGFTPVYYLVSILCYIQEVSSVEREQTWCVPSGVDYVQEVSSVERERTWCVPSGMDYVIKFEI